MNVLFGAVSGAYTLSQQAAEEKLERFAKAAGKGLGVCWDIKVFKKATDITIGMDGQTVIDHKGDGFTARASGYSGKDSGQAEQKLKLLVENTDGFFIDTHA